MNNERLSCLLVDTSPFTLQQIEEWKAFGPKILERPTDPSQLALLKERKANMNAMKKRLVTELAKICSEEKTESDPKVWSERAIEKELNRLVAELSKKDPRPDYQKDNLHPDNIIDYRDQGGPSLRYLWSKNEPLNGQTLYLGGEVGSDGNIYCIPGHASRVLMIDCGADEIFQIGPALMSNGRLYKWLRGIVVGDIIYGLPCHADEILKIDVSSRTISKLPIPYEMFFDGEEQVKEQREMIWKYHGGTISPIDNCIYAIPQRAHRVLKIDPKTETISFVGPDFPGKCKWYGGVLGTDNAIYGVPHNASGVLRITPNSVTVHGDFGSGSHKWHGGSAAGNGVIVCVPANSENILCIIAGDSPDASEPILKLIGDKSIVQSGRHRDDGKYKYLGATCGPNGKVYFFPCASEFVLEVDANKLIAKNIGPNLRDSGLETVNQNKWQNGLACRQDGCVYGISLSGHTLLKIDCNVEEGENIDPEVTTWKLPSPRRDCRDKFEGGVITPSGIMYTVPNNHKGVLRIEPNERKIVTN
mmetsp:Transcript_25484/g.37646  ORF Transcript_25484/g.37646 Transcript_25484/m.37646 type:complete len:531 (+) Transcript_25484:222-1814(+)|eukprot:CAMPEP_0194219808 /NCGR_PEP_ID=MMETSP0156-20130528/26920_1 /TAXON_ID=33649 /ORGANISM="Thalassionema nitzschioides, Strain L26-B" /LENGTH=530 /DNA_ID=CAMNT_0038949611 /DNA_START=58 /DNA_END=1650 /DNA_ORIENTATION=+